MANLSSKTGFTPVQTRVALGSLNSPISVQDFAAYDAQELTGFVYVDATADLRASVKVMVVKNGAGVWEVAAVDLAGDDYSGAPLVSFSMSGSMLRATLPAGIPGFVGANSYIQYQLNAPALGGNFPLTVDGSNVTAASATAQGVVTTSAQTFAGQKIFNASSTVFTDGTRSISIGNDANEPYFGTFTNNSLRLFTNSAERMRITAAGNVSIYTTQDDNTINLHSVANRPALSFYNGALPGTRRALIYVDGGGFATGANQGLAVLAGTTGGVVLGVNATSWAAVSDERKKKNIKPLEYGLEQVLEINPVRFDYKTDESDNSERLGFIAQNILPQVKEAVTGEESLTYSVSSTDLVPVLVNAIKELSAKVDAQAAEIAELKARS